MVIGDNGVGSCQTLSRHCPESVRRRMTSSGSLWQPLGYLWDTSDSVRQLLTTVGQPMATSDSLWAPSGQPLDSGQRLTTINF